MLVARLAVQDALAPERTGGGPFHRYQKARAPQTLRREARQHGLHLFLLQIDPLQGSGVWLDLLLWQGHGLHTELFRLHHDPVNPLLTAVRIGDRGLEVDCGRIVRHVDAHQRAVFACPPSLEEGDQPVTKPSLHGGRIPFSNDREVEHPALLCREDFLGSRLGRVRNPDGREHAPERGWEQERDDTVARQADHTEGYRKTRWPETC